MPSIFLYKYFHTLGVKNLRKISIQWWSGQNELLCFSDFLLKFFIVIGILRKIFEASMAFFTWLYVMLNFGFLKEPCISFMCLRSLSIIKLQFILEEWKLVFAWSLRALSEDLSSLNVLYQKSQKLTEFTKFLSDHSSEGKNVYKNQSIHIICDRIE